MNNTLASLEAAVAEYGAANLLIIFPCRPLRHVLGLFGYTSSNDPEVMLPCKIKETRYAVSEGYKIDLDPMYEGYSCRSHYLSDVNGMIAEGRVQVFNRVNFTKGR